MRNIIHSFIFLLLSLSVILSLAGFSYKANTTSSDKFKYIVVIEKEIIDSSMVLYSVNSDGSFELARYMYFEYPKVKYYLNNNECCFITETLLSTCSTNGNNKMRITFDKLSLHGKHTNSIIRSDIESDQHYGTFRRIYFKEDNIVFEYNERIVKTIPIAIVDKKTIEDFLK